MDRKYWERIAPDYNEEIFDVLKNDRKDIIRRAIGKVADTENTVADLGCAVGKWLPLLSPLFKKVLAVDISARNLDIAKTQHAGLKNIEYIRADMSSPQVRILRSDAAICINAILTASQEKRNRFFNNLSRTLKKNGQLILVVPSLESWMLTRVVQSRWQIDKKLFSERLTDSEGKKRYKDLQRGNAEIDQVPTKHYLREELQLLLEKEGFDIVACRKIEYDWQTEFVQPPRHLKGNGPWDWMVHAVKE